MDTDRTSIPHTEQTLPLSDAIKMFHSQNILLWDVLHRTFVLFKYQEENLPASTVNLIPESSLPPVLKSEMIKRLKTDVEREISDRYLGKEVSDRLTAEQREYETFSRLYAAGMRRTNNPQNEDERFFNRLYDRYYKRMIRTRKSDPKLEEELKCPYVYKTNGKIHHKGDICGAAAKSTYGGYCSKHKSESKIVSVCDGDKKESEFKVMDQLLSISRN